MRRLKLAVLLSAALVSGYQSALERGIQAYNKDDFGAAERAFLDAVKEQPTSARAQKMLGLTYATVWQGLFDVSQSWGGATLTIDVDVANSPSPSTAP